jgi:putative restriction endonuclease
LEAAHIKPYAEHGPHLIANGILLREDLHTLFDGGYVTVTEDFHVEVSSRIREQFENGREYYKHDGQPMENLPAVVDQRPSREFLRWHNENKFLG